MSKLYVRGGKLPAMEDMKIGEDDRRKMLRFLVGEMADNIFSGIAPWCKNNEIHVRMYITTEEGGEQ